MSNRTIGPRGPARLGIDVSHHQGRIDWHRVVQSEATINGKPAGPIRFAYVRSGDGVNLRSPADFPDREVERNVAGCVEVGLPFGVYHYWRAGRSVNAQCDYMLRAMGEHWSLPPAINVEFGAFEDPQRRLDRFPTERVADTLRRAADYLEKRCGRHPILWVRRAWRDYFAEAHPEIAATFAHWDLAVMYYSERKREPRLMEPWTDWRLWQQAGPKSVEGRVPGISTRVDLDWFNGGDDAWHAWLRDDERDTDPAPPMTVGTMTLEDAREELRRIASGLKSGGHVTEAARLMELAEALKG